MIREYNPKDKEKIDKLGKNLKSSYNSSNTGEYEHILVYEEDNIIKGFIQYLKLYETLEIFYLVIDKKYRRQKIGTKLLDYLFKLTKAQRFLLEVNENNNIALQFYKNYGFKDLRIIKNYYNGIENAIVMEKVNLMKDVYILGIETSCDETSISIIKNGCIDIYTSVATQIDIHKEYGGVVPEIASRMHTENITLVLEDVLKKSDMKIEDMDAIAVTYAPGLMGCLLVGLEFAKTLALAYDKPLIGVNHIAGHIYANNLVEKMEFPSLGLVVSGGHTELVLMKDDYNFEVIGKTLDDAVGECYDKVARIIGLKYPGGPNVDKYALKGTHSYELPVPMNDESLNFSYSGLKSYIINLVHNEKQRGHEINPYDLAKSFQDVAVDELVRKSKMAIKKYDIKRMIIAGGVSANAYLREEISKLCSELNVHLSIPPLRYCTDNAAMIAAAAYPLYIKKKFSDFNLNAKSQETFFDKKDQL